MQAQTLKNGLKLYLDTNENLHSACVSFLFHAGPVYENKTGISHFLEHMVYHALYKDTVTLFRYFDTLGLTLQGTTYSNYIKFTVHGAREQIIDAFRVLCGIYSMPSFSLKDFTLEKKVIFRQIENKYYDVFLNHFNAFYFAGLKWEKPIMGNKKDVSAITLQELNSLAKSIFVPANSRLIITGNLPLKALTDSLSVLEALPPGKSQEYQDKKPVRFCARTAEDIIIKRTGGMQSQAILCFDIPSKLLPYANIVGTMLAVGVSSHLNTVMRAKYGLVADLEAAVDIYPSFARLTVRLAGKTKAVQRMLAICAKETVKYSKELSQNDWEMTKQYYTTNLKFTLDSPEALNNRIAYFLLEAKESISVEKEIEQNTQINLAQLKEAFLQIFCPANLSAYVLNNGSGADKQTFADIFLQFKDVLT